jgi:putative sigma-54 modulation protein
MKINRIKGTNMELTEVIKSYINEKIGNLDKYWDAIIDADVEVGLITTNQKSGEIFRCEVNLRVPGEVVRVVKTEKDLYKAIDKVKDHLRNILEEKQGRRRDRARAGRRELKQQANVSPVARGEEPAEPLVEESDEWEIRKD